jgi:hypothetical protein
MAKKWGTGTGVLWEAERTYWRNKVYFIAVKRNERGLYVVFTEQSPEERKTLVFPLKLSRRLRWLLEMAEQFSRKEVIIMDPAEVRKLFIAGAEILLKGLKKQTDIWAVKS